MQIPTVILGPASRQTLRATRPTCWDRLKRPRVVLANFSGISIVGLSSSDPDVTFSFSWGLMLSPCNTHFKRGDSRRSRRAWISRKEVTIASNLKYITDETQEKRETRKALWWVEFRYKMKALVTDGYKKVVVAERQSNTSYLLFVSIELILLFDTLGRVMKQDWKEENRPPSRSERSNRLLVVSEKQGLVYDPRSQWL